MTGVQMYPSKLIAGYFLKRAFDSGETITPMKLLKLTYIAHGWSLGVEGTPLISETVEAWKYGPVIPELYHAYKRFGNESITQVVLPDGCQKLDLDVIDSPEKTVLEAVWANYGKWDGLELSAITHMRGTPWDITWNKHGGKTLKGAVIPNDLIRDHYKEKFEANKKSMSNA